MDNKLKILLCEDDENLGMLLREFLQAKGFRFAGRTSGESLNAEIATAITISKFRARR